MLSAHVFSSLRVSSALATGAAFTWLNPHVYLDTLGLVGAVSTQYVETAPKTAFGIGAVTASFVFFFALGYGARLLAPIMQSARAWRVLDVLIGLVMWALAVKLPAKQWTKGPSAGLSLERLSCAGMGTRTGTRTRRSTMT